jgi:protein tyrosine/serine phosphatase
MMICRKNVAMTIVLKKLWINGLSGLYRFILISGKARIAIVLKEIADSSSPVLFNCSWGKDRTGIIAALLLKILGVSENDIARDFELTEKLIPKEMLQDRIPNTFRIVVFKDAEERQRILNEITSSPKKAILDVFEMLKNEFGSMENYLDEIGFGRSWRLKIQEKYLTDA